MSVNTQSLILDRIESILISRGLVVAIDFTYANTGVIRALGKNLNLVSQVTFDFQVNRIEFKPSGQNPIATYWYGEARKPGQAPYVQSSISDLIKVVCDFLAP
ncbi:MAG TPA: hypothetical protein PLB92_00330 [Rhodoglobus sp.]|nr:hypothetical protein [Rhodoglobus sp.]